MAKEYPRRTRFAREIVTEFVIPPRKTSQKVIILCGGMPGYPGSPDLLFFLAKKGYWVFRPRYRGTWESDGEFLKSSPHEDVLDIITQLSKGFTDAWSKEKFSIAKPEVYVIGSSFGGPAALLASLDKRVKKVVAFAPVIDWRVESKLEPLDFLAIFTAQAFGQGYRGYKKHWKKLKTGKFYNPVVVQDQLDPKKIFILHAKDDEIVYAAPSKKLAKEIGCALLLLPLGGHLSSTLLLKPRMWQKVQKFISQA